MKKQIENLIKIAKEYHEIGMALNLPMTHNHVRREGANFQNLKCFKEGKPIIVYLNDKGKTWQVEFDKIKIVGYTEKIELPFDFTDKYLQDVYEDVKDHLEKHLKPRLKEFKLDLTEQKLKEIKKLEEQLKELKSQL